MCGFAGFLGSSALFGGGRAAPVATAMAGLHPPSRSRSWRAVARRRGGHRLRPPPPRHRRPLPGGRAADDVAAAGATSPSTMARSTTISTFGGSSRRRGIASTGGVIATPRPCSPRSRPGACEARSSVRSACSPSRCGTGASGADPRPRPARREAALLRLAGRGRGRRLPVRLGAEGASAAIPPSAARSTARRSLC